MKSTVQHIMEHLRDNPSARVLLVVPNNVALNDEEKGIIEGDEGLLGHRTYGKEFSGRVSQRQVTHIHGGLVYPVTVERLAASVMQGHMFSMVVFNNIPNNESTSRIRKDAALSLRIPPFEWVESTNGEYEQAEVGTGT